MTHTESPWSARTVAAVRGSRRKRLQGTSAVMGLDRVEVLEFDDERCVLRAAFVEGPNPSDRHSKLGTVRPWHIELSRADGGGPAPLRLLTVDRDPLYPSDALRIVCRPTTPGDDQGLCELHLSQLAFVDVAFRDAIFPLGTGALSEAVYETESVVEPQPTIDYTARDFDAVRTTMLDRMAVEVPGWTERHPADQGVMLVEVLAFAADMLAYRQDAVGTEAYPARARTRTSMRRHARLLGRRPFDGLNARAFACLEVDDDLPQYVGFDGSKVRAVPLARGTPLLTEWSATRPVVIDPETYWRSLPASVTVFETVHDQLLWPLNNSRSIYTWGSAYYALAAGATQATLTLPQATEGRDPEPERLVAGDVVLLVARAVVGDTLQTRRIWPVRLVADPEPEVDPLEPAQRLSRIRWSAGDALPADFVVAAVDEGRLRDDLVMVLGNVVLADHGRRRRHAAPLTAGNADRLAVPLGLPMALDTVSAAQTLRQSPTRYADPAATPLARMTVADPVFAPTGGSARMLLTRSTQAALPVIDVYEATRGPLQGMLTDGCSMTSTSTRPPGSPPTVPWSQRPDLLRSRPFDRDYVVELSETGAAELRFGDGVFGRARSTGSAVELRVTDDSFATVVEQPPYLATWREGIGPAGNIGADTLRHVVTQWTAIRSVSNPLAASGGRAAEPLEAIRSALVSSSTRPVRCLTVDEWTRAALQLDDVAMVAVDPHRSGVGDGVWLYLLRRSAQSVDQVFAARAAAQLQPLAIAGTEVVVTGPRWVPLDVALDLVLSRSARAARCRSEVARRVGAWLGRTSRESGRVRFGETIHASGFIERAMEVDGVEQVTVTRLQRRSDPVTSGPAAQAVPIADVELATVGTRIADADPGRLVLTVEGGR